MISFDRNLTQISFYQGNTDLPEQDLKCHEKVPEIVVMVYLLAPVLTCANPAKQLKRHCADKNKSCNLLLHCAMMMTKTAYMTCVYNDHDERV